MVRNMTIVAMITPTMATGAFTTSNSRRSGISANRRSAIFVSARSLRSSQAAGRHHAARVHAERKASREPVASASPDG